MRQMKILITAILTLFLFSNVALANTADPEGVKVITINRSITDYMEHFGIRNSLFGDGDMINSESVNTIISDLAKAGVNINNFSNTEIYLFPACCLQERSQDDPVAGFLFKGDEPVKKIVMAGQYKGFKNSLLHELGHVVWSNHPEIRNEYVKMRKYAFAIDQGTQDSLVWGDKLGEYFAEDFKYIYGDGVRRLNIYAEKPDMATIEFLKAITQRDPIDI